MARVWMINEVGIREHVTYQVAINEVDSGAGHWIDGIEPPEITAFRQGKTLFDGPSFDGYPIKVTFGATGRRDRLEFFYGGQGLPDGVGHGHVVSNDGIGIHYWRLPDVDGGAVVINDRFSTEQLASRSSF